MSTHYSLKEPRTQRKVNPCIGQQCSKLRKQKNKAANAAALAAEAAELGITTIALAGQKMREFKSSAIAYLNSPEHQRFQEQGQYYGRSSRFGYGYSSW